MTEMFLHIVPDEKFIDDAIYRFQNNDPGNHRFVHLTRQKNLNSFKYIKNHKQVAVIQTDTAEYTELLSKAEDYTAVFAHNLIDSNNVEFVIRATKNTVFVWLYWGAEVWSLKEFRSRSLLPSTRLLFLKNNFKRVMNNRKDQFISNIIKYKKLLFKKGPLHSLRTASHGLHKIYEQPSVAKRQDNIKKAMMRADYIIPVVEDDYYLLKKMLGCKGELLDWNYTPGVDFDKPALSALGPNILVGNSAHYGNNHLEIFKQLRKSKVEFEKIIVPLSYGDPIYKRCIMEAGKKMFGKRFWGLEGFLSIEEYIDVLSSCSMAFFNNVRQQATGNIIIMIFLGASVFLREENPVLNHLEINEVQVFSVQKELRRDNVALTEVLSNEVVFRNRERIKKLFSEKTLDQKTKNIITFLKAQKKP